MEPINKKAIFGVSVSLILFLVGCSEENTESTSQADQIVKEIVEIYGGDKLINLQTFIKEERLITYNVGQSRHPGGRDDSKIHYFLAYDGQNNRAALESWYSHSAGNYHFSQIIDPEKSYTVDFGIHGYSESEGGDPKAYLTYQTLSSAPLLVKDLYENRESAENKGVLEVDGKEYQVIQYNFQGGQAYSLFFDPETNFLVKATRATDSPTRGEYLHYDHQEEDGIMVETGFAYQRRGEIEEKSNSIKYTFNTTIPEKYFQVPEGFSGPIKSDDVSSMVAVKIDDGVYHVGQGYGYSVFVDVGDHLVASGGYRGLTDRLEEFRKQTGNNKPLKYQIVTHHHSDHIRGMAEAAELGATLVTVAENVETIKKVSQIESDDNRFSLVSGSMTLGEAEGNQVEVYEFDSPHAERYLLLYLPRQKFLFAVDHFGSLYSDTLPAANADSVALEEVIEELGLDVETLVSGHMPRVFNLEDLKASNKIVLDPCFENRPVCS